LQHNQIKELLKIVFKDGFLNQKSRRSRERSPDLLAQNNKNDYIAPKQSSNNNMCFSIKNQIGQLCIAPLIINSELLEKLKKNNNRTVTQSPVNEKSLKARGNSLNERSISNNVPNIAQRRYSKENIYSNKPNEKKITVKMDALAEDRENIIKQNLQWKESNNSIGQTTMNNYKIIKLIGKGAFGKVSMGIHKLTGKYVAIKTIEKNHMKNEYSRKKVVQEVYILKNIKHSNVIK